MITHVLDNGVVVRWDTTKITSITTQQLLAVKSAKEFFNLVDIKGIANIMELPNKANSRQVGGTHYKDMTIQPWEAMKIWLTREEYIGYLRGNIIKYHARANSGKGTKQENLDKAAHYQQELTEFIKACPPSNPPTLAGQSTVGFDGNPV